MIKKKLAGVVNKGGRRRDMQTRDVQSANVQLILANP